MQNKNCVDFSTNIAPTDFALLMLDRTAADGALYLENWYDVDCEDCNTYSSFAVNVKWSEKDMEYAINEFNQLCNELGVIADHIDDLDGTPESALEILPDELVAAYSIYVAPIIAKNNKELNALVIGRVSDGICGYQLIRHSQRLCRLMALDAPEIVVQAEKRMLLASLILHLYGENIEKA